jgi:hypothetical protein
MSGPCDLCHKPVDPAHLVTPISGIRSGKDISILCADCCPEHGTPLLDAA